MNIENELKDLVQSIDRALNKKHPFQLLDRDTDQPKEVTREQYFEHYLKAIADDLELIIDELQEQGTSRLTLEQKQAIENMEVLDTIEIISSDLTFIYKINRVTFNEWNVSMFAGICLATDYFESTKAVIEYLEKHL